MCPLKLLERMTPVTPSAGNCTVTTSAMEKMEEQSPAHHLLGSRRIGSLTSTREAQHQRLRDGGNLLLERLQVGKAKSTGRGAALRSWSPL